MRIAYVLPFYPSLLETYIFNEMTEIQRAGHDLIVVPLYSVQSLPVDQELLNRLQGVSVLPSPIFGLEVMCLALGMLFTRPLRILGTLISLHWAAGLNMYAHASLIATAPKALATAWRLRRVKVDRIHAHFATHTTSCAGIAGRVCRIPFSFTAHAYDIYCTTPKLRNRTLSWKLRNAQLCFAVSAYAAGVLRQRTPAASDHIHIVYVGIPMDVFSEKAPLPRGGMLRLLCICRFGEKKGLDTLIEACALLRNQGLSFHLRLCGDGPLHEALAGQIARLRLVDHVTLGGLISQKEVAKQMEACHLFVMPCRRDRTGNMDGIPTVFIEAMATGRPVISCPISGIPELVRDGKTGLLVPPDDPAALAAAVRRLADDDALRRRLGRQGRAFVELQHDQRRNAGRLLEIMTSTPRPH
jgi:glycosyltransferase involved in cell wall biosynthesis